MRWWNPFKGHRLIKKLQFPSLGRTSRFLLDNWLCYGDRLHRDGRDSIQFLGQFQGSIKTRSTPCGRYCRRWGLLIERINQYLSVFVYSLARHSTSSPLFCFILDDNPIALRWLSREQPGLLCRSDSIGNYYSPGMTLINSSPARATEKRQGSASLDRPRDAPCCLLIPRMGIKILITVARYAFS